MAEGRIITQLRIEGYSDEDVLGILTDLKSLGISKYVPSRLYPTIDKNDLDADTQRVLSKYGGIR